MNSAVKQDEQTVSAHFQNFTVMLLCKLVKILKPGLYGFPSADFVCTHKSSVIRDVCEYHRSQSTSWSTFPDARHAARPSIQQ
jgi:hypothetical protein